MRERIAAALWAINNKNVSDKVAGLLDGLLTEEQVAELERIVAVRGEQWGPPWA